MRREFRERFHRHRLQRKPLVSDPGMHHGTCFTHVPWCMSGSLTRGGGENFPAFPAHAQPVILCIWQETHWLEIFAVCSLFWWHISVANTWGMAKQLHGHKTMVCHYLSNSSSSFAVNISRPRDNGRHFPDDIFKCIYLNEMCIFRLRFHWSSLSMVQLTILQHLFR